MRFSHALQVLFERGRGGAVAGETDRQAGWQSGGQRGWAGKEGAVPRPLHSQHLRVIVV